MTRVVHLSAPVAALAGAGLDGDRDHRRQRLDIGEEGIDLGLVEPSFV
jgi:hypothetical protein